MDVFAVWFYTVVGAAFIFAATYSGIVWMQVRGLRGLLMVMLYLGIAINAFTVVWFAAGSARIDTQVIVALARASLALAAVAGLGVADRYAASMNSHRALTTILYLWFIRISKERGHGT